jgi:hypothetical protein
VASCALISILVLAAPEDAAAKMRVAWASQYEWTESGVANAVLWFTYRSHWKGSKEGQEWSYEGRAQVVAVGGKIVRRHYPGLSEARRKQVERHVEWVLGRFARLPFEERFRDTTFEGPEAAGDGLQRITAIAPTSSMYYLLKDDRLVGQEWRLRSGDDPKYNRQRYTVGDLGEGYAILGEDLTWNLDGKISKTTRRFAPAQGEQYPYPQSYTYRHESSFGTDELELRFTAPTVNSKHPLIGDPAARDALKAGWARRHVLPDDIRIEAEWHRRVDKDLAQLHWLDTVKGELQVWGMDRVNVSLDERLFRDKSWTGEVKRLCEEHFRWVFGWLRDQPFDEEFKGCGFAFIDAGEKTTGVLVLGHGGVLGYLLEEGRIVGYRRNTTEEQDAWWRLKLKKMRDGRQRIDSIKAKIEGTTFKLAIKYQRVKGFEVPKKFEAIGGPRKGSTIKEGRGVAEYSLKKIKVTLPR